MKNYKADFMGATKSMADYYHGYSLMMQLLYGFSIVILWFASGFVNSQPAIARQVIYPIGVSYLIFGGIEYLYFPICSEHELSGRRPRHNCCGAQRA